MPLLFAVPQNPVIAPLDQAAQKRDIASLNSFLSPQLAKASPKILNFIATGGSYGVGKYGWHVYRLDEVGTGNHYAVFSTPLTCEDMGEQVFLWDGKKLIRRIPEDEKFTVRLLRNNLTARFDVANKKAFIEDRVHFSRTTYRPSFLFRIADHFKVSSIRDERGREVTFRQAGGVVSVAEPRTHSFEYTMKYSGVVDLYQYAGSVSTDEIILAQDYWYPSVGRNAAPYTLTSYTPRGWEVIGQGVLEGQKQLADTTVSHFRMDMPVVWYSFSAAPFKRAMDTIGPWRFGTWSKQISPEAMHAENVLQSDVIAFYNKTFSPYPFKSWGTVVSVPYGEGALEAYSYATYGAGGEWPEEDAHEPSHTWWGGILPNNYLHSQWNESFADFSQELFQRERELGNREERRRAFVGDAEPQEAFKAAPVADGPPTLGNGAGALGYGKGAMVLQMLEDEVGTDELLECMRVWIRSHRYGELEEWSGFENAVRRTTGRDYSWFFKEWLHRPGYADFEVTNARYSNGMVAGDIAFKGEPYRLLLEVLLEYGDGSREMKRVRIEPMNGTFRISVSRKPTLVSIDPWRRLLRTHHEDESPLSIRGLLAKGKRYVDPAHKDWLSQLGEESPMSTLPSDLDGVFLVGSPHTVPAMGDLCRRAGFVVSGDKLSYHGTTIDLNHGADLAVVELAGGGHCLIGLGKVAARPTFGRARSCVMDGYGRFLRGWTEPKTSGWMTFRL